MLYTLNAVTQAALTFQGQVGTAESFEITPFSASIACGVTDPVFTYKGTT